MLWNHHYLILFIFHSLGVGAEERHGGSHDDAGEAIRALSERTLVRVGRHRATARGSHGLQNHV